jgi:hypothetical protein
VTTSRIAPWLAAGLVLAALLALPVLAGAAYDGRWPADDYLEGYAGPYRGRVIDTETQQPIPGAVVVATWERYRILPFDRRTEFHAARETLTDANGEFVLDPRDVEENAPYRTQQPTFVIFKPGYGAFPSRHVARTPYTGHRLFQDRGTTIELQRASREERLRGLIVMDSAPLPDKWSTLLPLLANAVNEELRLLGMQPRSGEPRR